MAQIAITTLLEGPRNAVFHVAIFGDGSGDLSDETIVDPALFDPAMGATPTLRIAKLWYDLAGFDARLSFDYLASDTAIWSMSPGQPAQLDFTCLGGLADRSDTDGSGKLLLTTSGLNLGDFGTFVVWTTKT